MTPEARKATKEQVRKASEESMKENEELLKRLAKDELTIVRKMKPVTGWVRNEKEFLSAAPILNNRGLGDITTGGDVTPFSINVYPELKVVRDVLSEELQITEK